MSPTIKKVTKPTVKDINTLEKSVFYQRPYEVERRFGDPEDEGPVEDISKGEERVRQLKIEDFDIPY